MLDVIPPARESEASVPVAMPPSEPPPRRRRHIGRWMAALLLLAAATGAAWWLTAPPVLSVIHPLRGPAVEAAYATGTVEPTVMVPIAARTTARLVRLEADEGELVKQGQVLARLEDKDLQRSIDESVAEERYARDEYQRQAELVGRGVVSRSAFDRARTDWVKAKAAADRATALADFLKLVAPADGRIIRRDGEVGQLIAANQTVFWLSCCGPLRVTAEVDEEDITRVKPNQPVLLRADALPGQVFQGTVRQITPKGDPVARSYRVRITLPADTKLMVGMTTEANIILRRDEHALLLPAGAVVQGMVWVVERSRLVQRKVVIGARSPTQVEIRSGLADTDWVVSDPGASLTSGQAVRAVPATARP